ncbi:YusW family protein [Paenibacillus solisilvae]|uniref:YusW family protein n=1 Tax=Paenibacillus solisilvae TaxID=2486751 RepID=A0ABW0W6C7_9BACL
MKKKIAYMLIGALCSIILSYGFVAYADHDSSATTEDKPTAASDTYVVPPKAVATPKPATAQPSPSEGPIKLDQLKDLEIKIAGNGLKIEIELEREQAKVESKVEINRGQDQENHLTGSEAAQFIQQLLDAVKLQENMNKQQVLNALFKHFAVEPAKVEIKIEIKLTNRLEVLKYEQEKDDDDVNAKVQNVQKEQDDQKEQLANKDQLTQKEQKKALIAKKKALQEAWQKAHKEQQAKQKQEKQFARGDRDDDHHDGKQEDEDDDDDHDGDHGQHESHDHENHDNEDED